MQNNSRQIPIIVTTGRGDRRIPSGQRATSNNSTVFEARISNLENTVQQILDVYRQDRAPGQTRRRVRVKNARLRVNTKNTFKKKQLLLTYIN